MSSSIEKEKRLLIVDDSEVIRDFLSSTLIGQGFSVDTAANGIEALHLLNETDYDMILTDIRMPIMTGIELYHRIEHTCPKVANKVVFMSADTPDIKTRSFFKEIDRPFLSKPFTIDSLLNAIGE
jgi:CheY-like chemotaxis protein